MDISTYKKTLRILGMAAILMFPVYILIKALLFLPENQVNDKSSVFVGKESCRECHLGEYNDWIGSHHDKAMDVANDSTVLGNFSDFTLETHGKTHKMYRKEDRFFVYTDGEDGTMQEFEVKYVFGFTPLQQYLVEFDRGRLQTLPLTWNTIDSVWYHMADSIYKNDTIEHENWLHWTNQAQNWNGMCAECHSTNLVKGYNHETDSYHTTYSEIDVSCEACHGAGSRHVEWANLPEYSREDFVNYGLVVKTSGIDQVQYVDNCVRCHSRKHSLADFDHSTHSIYDHSIPDLPDEPSWFIDGQILDEDYVYASFLQSKMYEREVQCNDCHNVHSTELLFEGNDLCLQCHHAETYNSYNHHFHKEAGMPGEPVISESGVKFEVGSGTECINCHMHGRYYMGVDYRRDHSFRIPRPDLSIKHGTPNACNQCHTDETNQWADRYITQWFGESRRYHYSEGLAGAKAQKPGAVTELKAILENDLYPPNIRSLALEKIGFYYQDSVSDLSEKYINHLNPSFRLSSIRSLQVQNEKNINLLLSALTDDTKAVRYEAAQRLMQIGEEQIPSSYKDVYQKVLKEYEQVLFYNADFPTGKVNLANFYYNQNKLQQSKKYYLLALEQDSELYFIKLNLAYLYNRLKQNDQAEKLFREYLQREPEDAEALFSLGLLLTEMGKYTESLSTLLKVKEMTPERPRIHHNIAMMYDFMKDKEKAEQFLKMEIEVVDNLNSRMELMRFYIDNNQLKKALEYGNEILNDYPEAEQVKQAVETLENQL